MKNIKTTIKGDKLTIEIDLKKRHGKSSSGKSEIVGTTSGNVKLDAPYENISIGINCYEKV